MPTDIYHRKWPPSSEFSDYLHHNSSPPSPLHHYHNGLGRAVINSWHADEGEYCTVLADAHFQLDGEITRIFRIVEPDESNDRRPVKLLEVSPMTTEVGISPIGLNSYPARGVWHCSVVIEITPGEFDRLQRGELSLPHGWQIDEELFPRNRNADGVMTGTSNGLNTNRPLPLKNRPK